MNRIIVIPAGVGSAAMLSLGFLAVWKDRAGGDDGAWKDGARKAADVMPLRAGESLRSDWPPEEVFRRAFWRNPGPGDRIVHAERFESSGPDGVNRWAWFMEIHPSPELLRDLLDPETFGVLPADKPVPSLPRDIRIPGWYRVKNGDGVKTFQHPSGSLVLHYHAADNRLRASDHGKGFAAARGE